MDLAMFQKTTAEYRQRFRWVGLLLIPLLLFTTGPGVSGVRAQEALDDAKILIETNFTDGDAGIQVFLDGEGWKQMSVKDPNGKKVFDIKAKGNLKNELGLTELFWESEEPNYLDPEELTLAEILELFPEGDYEFKGKSVEGDKLTGSATLSHELPCGPDNLSPAEETVSPSGVDITWDSVVTALNATGDACSADPITIETYEVIVEDLATGNRLDIFLPAGVNMVEVPDEFIDNGKTYKYEVLAIADNGNQTISETYFCTGTPGASCTEPAD
jgi:hypothetical protein